MRPDGRTARFPAIGRISGDWGGGWGLAEEALWSAARAEDGRGAPTDLARTLPAYFGLRTMYDLIEALHLERLAPHRRHELTPVLFATAAAGDAVARGIVDRLAEEVVALATVALTRLDLLAEEAPVLLGGGVLTALPRTAGRRGTGAAGGPRPEGDGARGAGPAGAGRGAAGPGPGGGRRPDAGAAAGALRGVTEQEKRGVSPTPRHSQRIAHRGACGKAPSYRTIAGLGAESGQILRK